MAKGKKRRGFVPPVRGQPRSLQKQMEELQAKMLETQEALGEEKVTVTAGGGAITVVMTGHQRLESIVIDPEVVNPDDIEMLQDLVVAAVNEAIEQSQALAANRLSALTGGLRIPGLL